MRVFRIPDKLRAIVFDIDSTLYENEDYARYQTDCQIERLAKERGRDLGSLRGEISRYREVDAVKTGVRTSLGNILTNYGVDIATSVRWREELIDPMKWLEPDPKLVKAVGLLALKFSLACVTNNPVLVGRKTLDALGLGGLFETVVGLDSCMVSKPHEAPFRRALYALGVKAEEALAVGDRYDVDLAIPLDIGMGGVLVSGPRDVLELPELLGAG